MLTNVVGQGCTPSASLFYFFLWVVGDIHGVCRPPKPKLVAEVLFDYQSTEPAEITIVKGEVVEVLIADVGDGWSQGRNVNGDVGLYPTSYARML